MMERCYCDECRPRLTALYDGAPCVWCGHQIHEGDDITTEDGLNWIHEECAGMEQQWRERRTREPQQEEA